MASETRDAADGDNAPIEFFPDIAGNGALSGSEWSDADDLLIDLTEAGPFGASSWLAESPVPFAAPAGGLFAGQTPLVSAAPSITGTTSTTGFVTSGEKIHPFANIIINDPNAGAIDTITIWIAEFGLNGYLGTNGKPQGNLTGTGVMRSGASHDGFGGVFTLKGNAATDTKELQALFWTVGVPYATPTQTEFTIELQSNAYGKSETDQNTNYVNTAIVTTLAIGNRTGDYIPIPSAILPYGYNQKGGFNSPTIFSITPFYTNDGKNAFLFVTYMVYPANIALPVQILGYNPTTKSFADVTKLFFGSNVPDTVEENGVVVADFNGDGRPDFFLPDWGPDSLPILTDDQLWLSTSSGTYKNASATLPAVAAGEWSPTSGVVDKQGDIGIVDAVDATQFYKSNTFFTYFINRDGTLTNATSDFEPAFPSGSHPDYALLTDVNGDGLADLICSFATHPNSETLGEENFQVELFLNPGDGDFHGVAPIVLPQIPFGDGPNISGVINSPQVTAVASFKDWRGDFDDLVVISNTAGEEGYAIQILINNGSNGFADETSTRLLGSVSEEADDSCVLSRVFTADLNGEGPSIITQGAIYSTNAEGSPSQVFLNNGHDVFNLAYSLTAGDFGNTGLNPYFGMTINAVENIGGTEYLVLGWAQRVVFVPYEPPPVLVHPLAEINEIVGREFKLTIPANIFADPNGFALTYDATGAGLTALPNWLTFDSKTRTFTATGAPPGGLYSITITARDPYGWLAEDTVTLRVTGAVPDDFTGDAVSDILWRNAQSGLYTVWILKNGKVSSKTLFNPGPPPAGDTFVATADFNGFGLADPLFQNRATGALTIWNTNGGVDEGSAQLAGEAPSTGWSLAGIADIDVPTPNWLEPTALLWVNGQTGTAMEQVVVNNAITATYTLAGPGAGWSPLGTGNFSGTTAVDVLFQNQQNGELQDWRTDAGAVVEDTTFQGPGAGWTYVGAGDFLEGLGEKNESLLFANTAGQLKLYDLDDGASTGYAALSAPALPNGFAVAAIGDFNGDGISDVLISDKTTGAVDVGFVNASGAIAAWRALGAANPSSLQLIA